MKDNIIALLAQGTEADTPPAELPRISFWGKGTLYLAVFTLHADEFASHHSESKRTRFLCLGAECPACRAGVKVTEHLYLSVWDVQNRRVAVLTVHRNSEAVRRLLEFLTTYQQRAAIPRGVRPDGTAAARIPHDVPEPAPRPHRRRRLRGRGRIRITAHEPLPQTDRGATACEAFAKGLEAGTLDLRDCVRRLTADEIARLPEVSGSPGTLVGAPVPPGVTPAGPLTRGHLGGPREGA